MLFLSNMITDVKAVMERDPAAKNVWEVFFLYPGVRALRMHRRAHFFWKLRLNLIAKAISFSARKKTGIEYTPVQK